jgi:hypothetical protein
VKDSFYVELECVFDKFPKQHLEHFTAEVGAEYVFKPTIGNEGLLVHEISNIIGVRAVNFATSKNLTVKVTTFPYLKPSVIYLESPDREANNQIGNILIDGKQYSNVLVF